MRAFVSFLLRAGITVGAFWWIFQMVDVNSLSTALQRASRFWIGVAIGLFFVAQIACITRWRLLVPLNPALRWGTLANSFFVACFFNTLLPTTVGGDVIRSADLIKVTGQWRQSLACVLMDRLLGVLGFFCFGIAAWIAFPPAREDPVIRLGFLGFCGVVGLTFALLSSRRILMGLLRPFRRIGLGQIPSHAKQFQETLLAYLKQPRRLLQAFGVSLLVQVFAILMFGAVSKALELPIPLFFLFLVVPIVITISQLPISLNGWGIREGATILFLQRIQIPAPEALSLSLLSAAIPFLAGLIGGMLFLARRKGRRPSMPSTPPRPQKATR